MATLQSAGTEAVKTSQVEWTKVDKMLRTEFGSEDVGELSTLARSLGSELVAWEKVRIEFRS